MRELVTVNESFEKTRTTGRETFGTDILLFGRDLREDPREKHEEQVGVREEEPAGRQGGSSGKHNCLGHGTLSFLLSSEFCLIISRIRLPCDVLRQV